MPVASFEVENYRSFAERTAIELRPLTLLFGYNSSGKSALLRFLPLLASAVEPGAAKDVLNLRRSPAARDATFNDLRCRLPSRRGDGVHFAVEWDDEENPVKRIEIGVLDLVGQRRQVVEIIHVSGAKGPVLDIELELPESEGSGPLSRYTLSSPEREASSPGHEVIAELDFDGLVPSFRDANRDAGASETDHFQLLVAMLADRLRSLPGSIHWIGSLRHPPPRRGDSLRGPLKRLDSNGSGAVEMLAFNPPALAEASRWYEQATGHRLEVVRNVFANDEQASAVLSHLGAPPVQIPIADTGEGMAQVLPVVTLSAMAKLGQLSDPGPVLAFEQPELHLHPRAHAEVAALFCQLAEAKAARILVETHSENLLLRVQLAIVRGEISADRVVVYWLRQLDNGASIAERITFDDLARPLDDRWPPGVFSEDIEQARAIVLERRKRGHK